MKRKAMGLTFRMLLVIGFVFVLTACGEDAPAPVQKASTPAPKPQPAAPPVEAVQAAPLENKPAYSYNPIGRRDPFESLLNKEREAKTKPRVPLTPLEKFELGQFRLQALLIGKGAPRAMISAPDGKTYIVSPGVRIGKREGNITDISHEGIIVQEIAYNNFTGEQRIENQIIKMPEQKAY